MLMFIMNNTNNSCSGKGDNGLFFMVMILIDIIL